MILKIHFRILALPEFRYPDGPMEMLKLASALFEYHETGIQLTLQSMQHLILPPFENMNVSACTRGYMTQQQYDLLAMRTGAESHKDVFVFFVQSLEANIQACAVHPPDMPGLMIGANAPGWTLAHELGHILGLNHANDSSNNLMYTQCMTLVSEEKTLWPLIGKNECKQMKSSHLLFDHAV